MAHTTLVPGPTGSAVPKTDPAAEVSQDVVGLAAQDTPSDSSAESSRVASIRSSLQGKGVSGQASDLILASWREATEVAYSCNWRRWEWWCSEHRHDQMYSPIRAILDFLAEQYHQGKQYRTINSYRLAISMTHLPIDGVVIGKHPLITHLMRGVYNTRPPQPKYSSTWDVGHVLGYIGSGGPNQSSLPTN